MGRPWSRVTASAALAFACLVAAPTNSWADESAAETFFQEGLAAMKRNDFTVACEAFSQSNKADPSPGTQINLALCFEKQKKWASAWTWYRSAVGLAQQRGQGEREKLAEDSAARLKPQLHNLIVSVKEPLTDLIVKRDGVEVTIALAGKELPLPIDPGEHSIEVSARGKKPWTKVIQLADNSATDRVDVPKLEDAPVEAKAAGTSGPGAEYNPPVVITNDGTGQRTVGIVVGGAGLLAALAGAGVYILALNQDSQRQHWRDEAGKPGITQDNRDKDNAAADNYNKQAKNDQLIAIILGAGAGVLLATGAVLYFTSPKASKTTGRPYVLPVFGPSYAGLGAGGTF